MGIGASSHGEELPPLESLGVDDRLELCRHLRREYIAKVREIVGRERGASDADSVVSPTDIDDLMFAQMKLEGLLVDFRKLRDEGPMNEIDIDQAVGKIFDRYATNEKGQMSAAAFKNLMGDVMGNRDEVTEEEVQKLLKYMDKNGNGLIERAELVGFIIDGCSASPEERKDFSRRSPFHAKLTKFLVLLLASVAKTIGKGKISGKSLVASISKSMQARVESAVTKLFEKYDTDKSGEIEMGEFLKFMIEVVSDKDEKEPKLRDAQRFMDVIDPKRADKGSLSKKSVIEFAINVMTSTSEERMKFAASSTMHHKLIDFFLTLLLESLNVVTKDIEELPAEAVEARAEAVQKLVETLWNTYDEDGDESLNSLEFKNMIEGLTQGILSEQDCERFLRRMDTSGDGLIQQDEFCEFVEQGLSLSREDKNKYAARSPMHAMLVSVFVNAERVIAESGSDISSDVLSKKTVEKSNVPKSIHGLFDRLWDQFDIDRDGALDGIELNRCFLYLTGREIPIADCDRFLQRIDSSGDGKVQKDELVEFIENGMRLDPEKRRAYRTRSNMHAALLDLFDSVFSRLSAKTAGEATEEAVKIQPPPPPKNTNTARQSKAPNLSAEAFVASVWGEFDLDQDGALNAVETMKLLKTFTGHEVTEEVCTKFLKSIDEDGDAKIQPDELSSFIKNGIKLSKEDRKDYASRSPTHEVIVQFFNEVDLRLQARAAMPRTNGLSEGALLETKEEELLINEVVSQIWKKYDKDGTDNINAEEFKALMTDCCGGDAAAVPTMEESMKFLNFLDEDGNHTLERSEFHHFILYATRMTDNQRVEYAGRSTMHAKLMIFIQALVEEAQKK
jgi:Ca2+-binding EF-hand superfamily protein